MAAGVIFVVWLLSTVARVAVARGQGALGPADPVKIVTKKMSTSGNHIDFIFLAPY